MSNRKLQVHYTFRSWVIFYTMEVNSLKAGKTKMSITAQVQIMLT